MPKPMDKKKLRKATTDFVKAFEATLSLIILDFLLADASDEKKSKKNKPKRRHT